MKSLIYLFIIATIVVFPIENLQAEPVVVQSCNRQVEFDEIPGRAISHDINLTEMMLSLGLRDRMVGYTGISGWNKLDEKMRIDIDRLPELSPKYPTKEVLVGANADFFFAGWNYGMRVGGEVTPESLSTFDIKVYELTESCIHISEKNRATMEDFYNDLRNLGKIFRIEDNANELINTYQEEIKLIKTTIPKNADPVKVFLYDSGEDQPFTAGRYAIPTALIEEAGGKNITDDVESSWTTVGWETVVARNPEVIIIVNYGEVTAEQKINFLKQNPAFRNINAVKNDRFVVVEYVEATPGPRNINAIKKLVDAFWSTE